MIDTKLLFDEIGGGVGIWCGNTTDGTELARVVESVSEHNADVLSVLPDAVSVVWPWIEGRPVNIHGRFYVNDDVIDEKIMSDLTAQINMSFKHGARGAMVFVRYEHLADMVGQVAVIRDDLFFNRDLVIGVDIGDIDASDWGNLFENLKRINASSVCFVLTKDAGKKSDFVGRVYGMLNAWDTDFHGTLQFVLGNNFERIDQARRLVESIRPELLSGLRFFVNI